MSVLRSPFDDGKCNGSRYALSPSFHRYLWGKGLGGEMPKKGEGAQNAGSQGPWITNALYISPPLTPRSDLPTTTSAKAKRKSDRKRQGQGNTPTANSALVLKSIPFNELPLEVQTALTKYKTDRGIRGLYHNCDPVNGLKCRGGITAKEYYPCGKDAPDRLVSRSRSDGTTRTWFYSAKHTSAGYWYQEITGGPKCAGEPLVIAVTTPEPPRIESCYTPAATPLPTVDPPPSAPSRKTPENWEDEDSDE
jgi:hypothetical protein